MDDTRQPHGGARPDPQTLTGALSVCACFQFRKAARAVTQLYDEALQPSGLRSTQFVILAAIASKPTQGISQLARELVMDASTLNRNLRPLVRRGLISVSNSPDGRRKLADVSHKGSAALTAAIPLWNDVQTRLVDQFGSDRYSDLVLTLNRIVHAARV